MYLGSSQAAYTRGTGTAVSCRALRTRYSRITSWAVGSSGPRGGRRNAQDFPWKWIRWTSLEWPKEIFSERRSSGSPSLLSRMKLRSPAMSTVALGPVFSVAVLISRFSPKRVAGQRTQPAAEAITPPLRRAQEPDIAAARYLRLPFAMFIPRCDGRRATKPDECLRNSPIRIAAPCPAASMVQELVAAGATHLQSPSVHFSRRRHRHRRGGRLLRDGEFCVRAQRHHRSRSRPAQPRKTPSPDCLGR